MKIVKFRDTLDDWNEETYGILVEDKENDFGYGGDFINCLCCLGIVENGDFEIIDDNIELQTNLAKLLKEELGE